MGFETRFYINVSIFTISFVTVDVTCCSPTISLSGLHLTIANLSATSLYNQQPKINIAFLANQEVTPYSGYFLTGNITDFMKKCIMLSKDI